MLESIIDRYIVMCILSFQQKLENGLISLLAVPTRRQERIDIRWDEAAFVLVESFS
jgi:hypothetical protein